MARSETAKYTKPIPDFADVMTVAEYMECVRTHLFIDSDGMGDVVKDGLIAEHEPFQWIYPSQGIDVIPLDATHVVWYNK